MVDLVYRVGSVLISFVQRIADFFNYSLDDALHWIFRSPLPVTGVIYDFFADRLIDFLEFLGYSTDITIFDFVFGAGVTVLLLIALGKVLVAFFVS